METEGDYWGKTDAGERNRAKEEEIYQPDQEGKQAIMKKQQCVIKTTSPTALLEWP